MFRSAPKFAGRGIGKFYTFLISGQSNAYGAGATLANSPAPIHTVQMLGYDGRHKRAYEPTADSTSNIYGILADTSVLPTSSWFSSGFLDMAKRWLANYPGKYALLVSAARGSTVFLKRSAADGSIVYTESFALPSDPYDDATLFGRANQRRRDGMGQCVSAVILCGHETSGQPTFEPTYEYDCKNWIQDIRNQVKYQVPIINVSVGTSTDGAENSGQLGYQLYRVRMHQWKMTDEPVRSSPFKSAHAQPKTYHVPLWDQATADGVHFSRAAIDAMAIRLQYALQAALVGSVTNYFPRPIAITSTTSSVKVQFDTALQGTAPFDSLFRVFNDTTPAEVTPITPALATTTITNDSVNITYAAQTAGNSLRVTYGQKIKADAATFANALKNSASTDLVAPTFELNYTA